MSSMNRWIVGLSVAVIISAVSYGAGAASVDDSGPTVCGEIGGQWMSNDNGEWCEL